MSSSDTSYGENVLFKLLFVIFTAPLMAALFMLGLGVIHPVVEAVPALGFWDSFQLWWGLIVVKAAVV